MQSPRGAERVTGERHATRLRHPDAHQGSAFRQRELGHSSSQSMQFLFSQPCRKELSREHVTEMDHHQRKLDPACETTVAVQ